MLCVCVLTAEIRRRVSTGDRRHFVLATPKCLVTETAVTHDDGFVRSSSIGIFDFACKTTLKSPSLSPKNASFFRTFWSAGGKPWGKHDEGGSVLAFPVEAEAGRAHPGCCTAFAVSLPRRPVQLPRHHGASYIRWVSVGSCGARVISLGMCCVRASSSGLLSFSLLHRPLQQRIVRIRDATIYSYHVRICPSVIMMCTFIRWYVYPLV